MDYYLLDQNKQQIGPFSETDLRSRLADGSLSGNDWVWQEDWPEWRPVGSVIKSGYPLLGETLPVRAPDQVSSRPDADAEMIDGRDEAMQTPALLNRYRVWPFALALVCLLLPFVNVSCKLDPSIGYRVTGLQLVTGTKARVDGRILTVPSVPAAAVTTLAVVTALAFAIPLNRRCRGASGVVSAIGFLSTMAARAEIDGRLMRDGEGMFRVTYLVGFWALVICLFVGSVVQFYLAKAPSSQKTDWS